MQKRTLGQNLEVSALGLGCMSMSALYGPPAGNHVPRFSPDARKANMGLVDLVKAVAERKRATPAQVALAWLLAQKPWIVPIPGTTKLHRLDENLGAVNVEFTDDDLQQINEAAAALTLEGARLPEAALQMTGR